MNEALKAQLCDTFGIAGKMSIEAFEFTKDGVQYCALMDWETEQVHMWEDRSMDPNAPYEEWQRKFLLFTAAGKPPEKFGGPHGNTGRKRTSTPSAPSGRDGGEG